MENITESSNSSGIDGKYLPSNCYKAAKDTLVYRLSELVFGSLLASFILGFLGFSGSILSNSDGLYNLITVDNLVTVFTYLCISGIYSYYTAGLYLFYHTGILTMPSFKFENASRDFALSLLSAIAFGLSMLWPQHLMSLLSLIIFRSLNIQNKEHKRLTKKLYEKYFGKGGKEEEDDSDMREDHGNYDPEKLRLIEEEIKKSKLEGWKNSTTGVRIWVWVLFISGLAISIITEFDMLPPSFKEKNYLAILLLSLYFLLFLFLYFILRKVFNNAALFNNSKGKNNYDSAYLKLRQDIEQKK